MASRLVFGGPTSDTVRSRAERIPVTVVPVIDPPLSITVHLVSVDTGAAIDAEFQVVISCPTGLLF